MICRVKRWIPFRFRASSEVAVDRVAVVVVIVVSRHWRGHHVSRRGGGEVKHHSGIKSRMMSSSCPLPPGVQSTSKASRHVVLNSRTTERHTLSRTMADKIASVQAQLQSQSMAFQKLEGGEFTTSPPSYFLLTSLAELAGIIEARQRLDSQQSENELVLKVRTSRVARSRHKS
jgi:hypothetical protein